MSEPNEKTPGEQALEATHNPGAMLERARDANEGKSSNSSGSVATSTAQEHVPSTSDPNASTLPSSNKPDEEP
ncbi:hypothetical protein H6G89_07560 [Oscillatoria sp. FACHB-1407]|uniref:hypothetical protein n=1 Tax=Oscillatoria sp. FACHB-1407 TaxID=2692847 RepID=UPI001684EB5B|nr:hypothetical protein [Oscillatoria sp. FACHB-1407]MBD2460899.1 hypothetical protein [Oscillatoria sp. FACHB-1407]